jgi:drug/metabolite transporter (DMT)-like permease
MWFLFSVLAGALYTGEVLILRYLLRQQKDAWAFSFFYSLVGTVICLPFMLSAPVIPADAGVWVLALLVGLLIVGHNLLIFKASNFLEASLIGTLSKLRLVWVFILGVTLLQDPFNWQKLAGTLLAIIAGLVIMHNFKRPRSTTGVSLVLWATFLNAAVIILSKYLLGSFNAVSLTFFATFLPAVIFNFILMPRAIPRIKKLFKEDWRLVLLACALGSLANLALNQALSLHDASSVLVIGEAFLVLVLVGEHIWLKEKEYLWVKLLSVALAVAGAILMQIHL